MIFDVSRQRISNLLGQWQHALATSLSRNPDYAFSPIEVVEPKLNNVARPKPQAREQEKNRSVSPSERSRQIGRRDDLFDLIGLQIEWQRREPPMGESRD